jgi:putative phosphoribosyl transferase
MEDLTHDVLCMDASAEIATEVAPPEPAFTPPPFLNRVEAGKALARLLRPYELDPKIVVVGLPRGGIPVAYTVARALHTPLTFCAVRKLCVPGHHDRAMGAIAPGEICLMNPDVLEQFRVTRQVFDQVTDQETAEMRRWLQAFGAPRKPLPVTDRTVILVDDGIATGATMRAAIASMRQQGAERIIIATPVCTQSLYRSLSAQSDDIVCLRRPQFPRPVSETYEEFPLVQEDEVCRLLRRAAAIPAPV